MLEAVSEQRKHEINSFFSCKEENLDVVAAFFNEYKILELYGGNEEEIIGKIIMQKFYKSNCEVFIS